MENVPLGSVLTSLCSRCHPDLARRGGDIPIPFYVNTGGRQIPELEDLEVLKEVAYRPHTRAGSEMGDRQGTGRQYQPWKLKYAAVEKVFLAYGELRCAVARQHHAQSDETPAGPVLP